MESTTIKIQPESVTLSQFDPIGLELTNVIFEKFGIADQTNEDPQRDSQSEAPQRSFGSISGQIQGISSRDPGIWIIQLMTGSVTQTGADVHEFCRLTLQLIIDARRYVMVDSHTLATAFQLRENGLNLSEVTFRKSNG